jgi:ubiquinone/menaquinone biosynthesis C-methylase UbiE
MSDFDLVAAEFERHRALPDVATQQITESVLSLLKPVKVNLLDLGAGTGRLGRAFVSARIRYVGVDTSYAMLDRFGLNTKSTNVLFPLLVQADGCFLPFGDGTFTAVLLAHVLSALQNWQELLAEACRVLDSDGFLILAQRVGPANGVNAQLRDRLRAILASMKIEMPEAGKMKRDARTWLGNVAKSQQHIVAANWKSDCAPRDFINRHSTGARFSALPQEVREESMRRLSEWAIEMFSSLDALFTEEYSVVLDAFRF